MHLRSSTCRGSPVVVDQGDELLGTVAGMVVHPDTGAIEGVLVRASGFLPMEPLFLATADILHWGQKVSVRSAEVLAPLHELVRLRAFLDEGRTVLGQPIVTEAGRKLGTCRDVQFETKTFRLEWLFPKRFFRWGTAVPVSTIVEVRGDAIVVREPPVATDVREGRSVLKALNELTEAPVPPVPEAS